MKKTKNILNCGPVLNHVHNVVINRVNIKFDLHVYDLIWGRLIAPVRLQIGTINNTINEIN